MLAALAVPCAAQPSDQAAAPPAPQATSQPTPPSTNTAGSIAARLQSLYPATRFGVVNPTSWPGVYEVLMGANIAYVDESGQYFLFGHLYDMKAQRDVTAERKESLAQIDFASLPLSDAIKEVRGNGARVLAIFSDPDCPYCKRLESDLRPLTDVTLYTFLMPIASLHPTAHDKAVAVWCAKDRVAAWNATMRQDHTLPHAECPHPIDRNIALGERVGIVGTPTIVTADGRVLPGAASKEQIEAWLTRSTASAQSAASPAAMPR
ncbi:MAG: DsbC family protein [Gammaproteobacteria bacterium]|nr:DsbC family protein [Gammaproteobacteria bacterium]